MALHEARCLLFAYGSLKRGLANHHELGPARFVAEVRTAPRFALRVLSGYPLLVPGARSVRGELFELPAAQLSALDAFEGASYSRVEIELVGGARATAYVARMLRAARSTPPMSGRPPRRVKRAPLWPFPACPCMVTLSDATEAHSTLNVSPDVEQRIQSRDRMASIGTLAAGVVHGINNPLSYVIANLEYVKRILGQAAGKLEGPALLEFADVLEDSLDGAERVRRIVSDIGSFSRPLDARVVPVDLEHAAERALSVAANEIRHRARVVRDFEPMPAVFGTEARLGQVILNVLINAAHAIEMGAIERNTITVRTRSDARGRPTLEIEDTGCGIARENLSRIFDPFFTTKPVGVGAGLGLSIAQRIAHELQGEISVESVHGQGTRVTLTLPAAPLAAPPEPAYESVPPFSSDRFRARILVIDDEPAILRAFRRVLVSHEVSVAMCGSEAMQKLAEGPAYDVIFCDVMMPEMSGVDVYQRISQQYPGQEHKIVFVTGGAFVEPAAHFMATTPNPTLKKPFTGSSLRALVATVTRLPARDL